MAVLVKVSKEVITKNKPIRKKFVIHEHHASRMHLDLRLETTSSTNPLNWTGHVQFDYFTGGSVNTQDINGVIAKTIYNDVLDRQTQSVSAVGTANELQSNIIYDDANRRVESKSDLNALNDNLLKSVSYYDGLGRTFETRRYKDGGYVAAKTEFDALGRVKRVTNPYRPLLSETALWTESFYDSLGRVVRVKTPDNAELLTNYSGNSVTVTDQAGKLRRSITNALGQLTRVDEPDSSNQLGTVSSPNLNTNYTYDTLNNLLTVVQGSSQARTFTYNSLSKLLSAANPESGTINYIYDSNGNLTQKTDARGVQTAYVYDALNRVTNRNYSTSGGTPPNYQASPNVVYTYDDVNVAFSKGKLTKVSSSASETRNTAFDNVGRVLSSQQITDGQTYSSAYAYNLSGALIEQTYPSGRVVKNILETDGDLSLVQSKKNSNFGFFTYANSFTYNAVGAVTSMQLGNGKWESTTLNGRLQPTQIALGTVQNGTDKLDLDYTYGTTANNGNVLTQDITVTRSGQSPLVFNQTYTYDELNRLKIAEEKTGTTTNWKQTFTFDRYGNRRFDQSNTTFPESFSNPNLTNPTFNASNNRMASGQNWTYDAAGNVTVDPDGRTFTYDAENKQIEAKNSSSATLGTYYFDGDGKRVKKVVPATGETTVFVYDAGARLVAEYSTVVQSAENAKVQYVTNDNLGTPRINTDRDGNVSSRSDYMPYGEEIISLGGRSSTDKYVADDVRQGFTGYENDAETGLDFAQARMYAKRLGRFSSSDQPFADQFENNPQTWNLYSYVRNNPLNLTDPLGMATACPPGWEGCIERDGKYYWIDAKGVEGEIMPEMIKIQSDDSGVRDERGSIKHPDGSRTMTVGEALQQQQENRERFILNNLFAGIGHGLGRIFGKIGSLFRKTPTLPAGTTSTTGSAISVTSTGRTIDMAKQGKHLTGHNNYISGRSVLKVDPQQLASRAGTGQQVGSRPVGLAGSKERVDFGQVIGDYVSPNGQVLPTTKGIIHYSSTGIHIVPAQP